MPIRSYKVRLAYFVPSDRQPIRHYEHKIRVLMQYVGELYRTDLLAKGYDTNGLSFLSDHGQPVVKLIRGEHPTRHYNGAPRYDQIRQWDLIPREVPKSVADVNRHLLVLFAETYDDGPANFEWPGGIALGVRFSTEGGLVVFSSWILRDEFCATSVDRQLRLFFDATAIPGRTALGHGQPNSPRFEFIEDGFGAVAHELGHAFGLPHDHRRDNVFVMGNGFRNLRVNLTCGTPPTERVQFSPENARLLMSSRYLASDLNVRDNRPPSVHVSLAPRLNVQATTLEVGVEASDDQGLRALLLYDPQRGSIVGGQSLQGRTQSLKLLIPVQLRRSGQFELQAFVTDIGGNLTRATAQSHIQ